MALRAGAWPLHPQPASSGPSACTSDLQVGPGQSPGARGRGRGGDPRDAALRRRFDSADAPGPTCAPAPAPSCDLGPSRSTIRQTGDPRCHPPSPFVAGTKSLVAGRAAAARHHSSHARVVSGRRCSAVVGGDAHSAFPTAAVKGLAFVEDLRVGLSRCDWISIARPVPHGRQTDVVPYAVIIRTSAGSHLLLIESFVLFLLEYSSDLDFVSSVYFE